MPSFRRWGQRRAVRRYRAAMEDYRPVLGRWDEQARELRSELDLARTFTGAVAGEHASPLQLHAGERVFCVAERAALVEPTRLPGHWAGGWTGFSFRVAKGVRYNVGGSRGHYEKGPEVPTPIDAGTATVTDRRVVFQGSSHAREWAFEKLLGYHHDPEQPMTFFQVANREKVSGVRYERDQTVEFHFRLALALAHFHGEVAELVGHLQGELAAHEAAKPPPPAMPAGVRSALPASPGRARSGAAAPLPRQPRR